MTRTTFRTAAIATSLATLAASMLLATPALAGSSRDGDHDGMPTAWEVRHHLNSHRANAMGDPDHDGLVNLAEFRLRTDPRSADSDDDGVEDGFEDADDDGVENENEDLCLVSTATTTYDDDCDDESGEEIDD